MMVLLMQSVAFLRPMYATNAILAEFVVSAIVTLNVSVQFVIEMLIFVLKRTPNTLNSYKNINFYDIVDTFT